MASERSIQAFDAHHQARHQFDYFVCGVAGAIFAYIVKDYAPQKLAFDVSILTPIALLLLACSFFAGLKRIEMTTTASRYNAQRLDFSEKAGHLTEVLMKIRGQSQFYDKQTGEIGNPEEIPPRRDAYLQASAKAKEVFEKAADRAKVYYILRDILLALGFAAILCAKIAQPYSKSNQTIQTGSPTTNALKSTTGKP